LNALALMGVLWKSYTAAAAAVAGSGFFGLRKICSIVKLDHKVSSIHVHTIPNSEQETLAGGAASETLARGAISLRICATQEKWVEQPAPKASWLHFNRTIL